MDCKYVARVTYSLCGHDVRAGPTAFRLCLVRAHAVPSRPGPLAIAWNSPELIRSAATAIRSLHMSSQSRACLMD